MSDDFERAVEIVMAHEGGLSENVDDAGGITNFGISLLFLRSLSDESMRRLGFVNKINEDTIKNLTQIHAKNIYKIEFWDPHKLSDFANKRLAILLFDTIVNHGASAAIKMLQRASWTIHPYEFYLKDDGVLGQKTLQFCNTYGSLMITPLIATRAQFYRGICDKNPSQKEFLNGWLKRCYSFGV